MALDDNFFQNIHINILNIELSLKQLFKNYRYFLKINFFNKAFNFATTVIAYYFKFQFLIYINAFFKAFATKDSFATKKLYRRNI